MGVEIERKFLINKEKFLSLLEFLPHCSYDIWQYYISDELRLRIETHSNGHESAYFTIKTKNGESILVRNEWQSDIDLDDAEALKNILFKSKIGSGVIRKTRHIMNHDSQLKWEIDIFHGDNEGLIIAEIEIPDEEYELKITPYGWIGEEVTNDDRYQNSYLAKNPYKNWSKNV
jgi:adenylate cyclase